MAKIIKTKKNEVKKNTIIGPSLEQFFLVALIVSIAAVLVHSIAALFEMGYYTSQNYFCLWSKIMMPGNSAPGMGFYLLSFFFAFITWLFYALLYVMVKTKIPGQAVKKGIFFGCLLFMVVGFPGFLNMYLLLAVPTALLIMWMLENLVIYLIGGYIIAKLIK